MAIIDDLVSSGLSLAQAQTVIAFNATTATVADLVASGFSTIQALDISAVNAGTKTSDQLTQDGIWFGTQVPAIIAALAV